jgi:hypothetical protein
MTRSPGMLGTTRLVRQYSGCILYKQEIQLEMHRAVDIRTRKMASVEGLQ